MQAQLTPAQTALLITRAQTDPGWWLTSILGASPWSKQVEICESVRDNQRTAVASSHGVGKSWIAARIVLWFLLSFRGSIAATTAPTFRQVQKVLWQEIRQAYRASKVPLGGRILQTELHLDDKWYAFGFSTDDANRFQGLHAPHVLAVFDEAAGVSKEIWTAAEGILTSEHCRLLAIGNPTESAGPFYEMFREPGVSKIHISAFDTPNVQERRMVIPGLTTAEWVEDKRRRWGEQSPVYQSRVLGRFPADSATAVIPLSWVEAAVERWRAWKEDGGEFGSLTCAALDVSDGGEDRSFLALRYGTIVSEVRDVTQADAHATMALAGVVVAAVHGKRGAMAIVDSIGVGAGIVSRLREQEVSVHAFNAAEGTDARDDSGELGFLNLRAAAWWGMRERLHPETGDGICLPPDDDLIGDLTAPTWKVTSRGLVQVESKDDIRKRLGRSTDRGDSVVMAFAAGQSAGGAAAAEVHGPRTVAQVVAGVPADENRESYEYLI